MKNILIFVITLFALQLILNSCGSNEKSVESKKDRTIELVKVSQVFDLNKCEYCSNPWSAYNGNKVQKMGLKPSINQYGEFSDSVSEWVFLSKVKLIIPPVGKSYAHLEIPFSYYSENCWGNTQREGTILIEFQKSAVDAIIEHSLLGSDFLTQSQNGDLFDIYLKSPEISIRIPKDACDVTYATFENPSEVFIKKFEYQSPNLIK